MKNANLFLLKVTLYFSNFSYFQKYAPTPINPITFLKNKNHTRAVTIDFTNPFATPNNNKVLIVEDEPLVLLAEKQMIKKMGCFVDTAENGELAVKMVCEQNKKLESKYGIILMDINMPIMNGYVASRKLKDLINKGEIMKTPIICLSAQDSKEHIEKCKECGILERCIFCDL